MPLDKFYEEHGLTLKIEISFSETDDGKMELFGFAVSNGCNCVDYSMVVENTTLADILEEFVH